MKEIEKLQACLINLKGLVCSIQSDLLTEINIIFITVFSLAYNHLMLINKNFWL